MRKVPDKIEVMDDTMADIYRRKTSAEIARLFKIHPATVSRVLAQARVGREPLACSFGKTPR